MDDLNSNPYSPPEATVEPLVNEGSIAYAQASAGLRFMNWIVDRIVSVGLVIGVGRVLPFLLGDEILVEDLDLVIALTTYGTIFCYYTLMEYFFGRTLAKFITRTRVVDAQGAPLGFLRTMGRTLCRFIPFEAFSFLGSSSRGWHDSITRTWVVDLRKPVQPSPPRTPQISDGSPPMRQLLRPVPSSRPVPDTDYEKW